MDNGVGTAAEVVAGGGSLQPVSVGAAAGDSRKPEVGGENEGFDEVMDTPRDFYTPHPNDSRDFVFKREVSEDALKLDESINAPIDSDDIGEVEAAAAPICEKPEEHADTLPGGPDHEEQEGETFEESFDAPVNAEEGVGSGEKTETPGDSDLAVAEEAGVETNGVAQEVARAFEDAVGDVDQCYSVAADGEEKDLVGESLKNEEKSDGSSLVVNGHPENGESDDIQSTERIPFEDGLPPKQVVAVGSDILSDRATKELRPEDINPPQDNTEKDNGVQSETHTTEGIKEHLKQSGGDIHDSATENGVGEDMKEMVLVEDLGESGLTDDDEDNATPQPVFSATSRYQTSGTPSVPSSHAGLDYPSPAGVPSLPSHPAVLDYPNPTGTLTLPSRPSGLGSSAPAGGPSLPSRPAVLGHPSAAGTPTLPSHPAGLGSSAPAGGPSLPSRPAGLGSYASAGGPSLPSRPTGLGSSAPAAGGPSLPSRPAGLGSSAPAAGAPSLPSRPAGLGSSSPLLEPAANSHQQPRANGSALHRQFQHSEELAAEDTEENDETREKLQMIRVKFLRLAHRLGQTPHNVVVAQVLYRLGLAEQLRRNTNRPGVFSFDQASVMAEQLETAGQEPLDFSCTIMVIGKTGVGKSATINSIFDEIKFHTNAFQCSTKKVQEIVGTVQGIKVRVIDMPGLLPSFSDQQHNEKILRSAKRFITKTPPDIVLYFDRLDMHSRDYGDVPLLRTITDVFGASIWFNAIIVLTHAASAPPDGPNGTPLSYEMFVTQRSHVVQQAIRQAAGDVRLMNPVSLVENHTACRMNRAGQRVLPNGQVWKPQLLLLSFASKILAEANTLLKLQDSPPGKPFGARTRVPPLPFLLTSLLQSRPQLKLPEEQIGDDDALDGDLDDASDSDGGSDYDELPPFRRLNKAQLEKLTKAQKKAYFAELDYREKLFFRKQLKEERKRHKLMKKMAEAAKDLPKDNIQEDIEDENSGPDTVPVPLPDYALPASFDSDNPGHRYRFLDSSSQWLVRPVLDSQGWDHDVGYEGLNVERLFVVKNKMPLSVSSQLTKDKKECNIQMEVASSVKHGEGKSTSLNLDMQTVGKDMAYTLRSETAIKNFRRNSTTAGVTVTVLGDSVSAGMKVEDKLIVNKMFRLLLSGGAMTGRGDVAYGGRLEATLRDKDYPIGRMMCTLALSAVDWHGDLALGCNIQSQLPLGRGTNLIAHTNLSNRGSGQVGIRLNSSEHLQLALFALVPILRNLKRILLEYSQSM